MLGRNPKQIPMPRHAYSKRALLGACSLAWLVAWAVGGIGRADDWPQWRGANRDGRVPRLPQTMPALKLLWQQKVAGRCDAGLSVVSGLLVMADHDDQHDYYACYRAAAGQEVWKRTFANGREMDYGAGPRAAPLIYQEKVYVLSAFGDLCCLELMTGATVWQKSFLEELGAKRVPRWGFSSSPLVAQGKLIVNPGGKAALVALDPQTGQTVWQGAGGAPNYSSFLAGTLGGVEQVIGYDAKTLGGWDLKTGKRLWSRELEVSGGYIVPTPVQVGTQLLVADSNNPAQLFAFDEHGVLRQTPVGQSEELAPEISTPVVAGGLVLGQAGNLVCLDAADQLKTLWKEEDEPAFQADCHFIVSADRGLAFSNQGELVLFRFDRQGVEILGKKVLCQKTLMHPTVVDGRLYVRDQEFLDCYDLTD